MENGNKVHPYCQLQIRAKGNKAKPSPETCAALFMQVVVSPAMGNCHLHFTAIIRQR
ncbi:MAG: hypothetical protein PHO01_11050 [Desulfotomaculaceae bacterium]|nr:hypothetical protein [Desulfotomaculaceae bacterium]